MYVRSQFMAGRLTLTKDAILPYVVLSLLYHAAAFPFAPDLYKYQYYYGIYIFYWILLLFFAPASIGLFLGLNLRHGWSQKVLNRIGITTVHPVDSAWDWRFGNGQQCWVWAKLKDGTEWVGYLGEDSFISTSPSERDILIDQVYDATDPANWTAKGSSVWIAHGELQSIEFWPRQGD